MFMKYTIWIVLVQKYILSLVHGSAASDHIRMDILFELDQSYDRTRYIVRTNMDAITAAVHTEVMVLATTGSTKSVVTMVI